MAVDPAGQEVEHLIAALDDALEIVRGSVEPAAPVALPVHGPASLLDQCLALCAQADDQGSEPVRSVHHFARTGGTLLVKCLAALPNVQVLSEVDPLSVMQWVAGSPRFAPTDLIILMRQSSRGVEDGLLVRLFLEGIAVIHQDCQAKGQRLLVRDHAHSFYCFTEAAERPTVRGMLSSRFAVLSVVTVRHPIESYLSLHEKGWISFLPGSLDEYCRRYLRFLDDHSDLPVFRYEDFVQAPAEQLRSICKHLQLPYTDDFAERFDLFEISGDTTKRMGRITPRVQRTIKDAEVQRECRRSRHYGALLERLGYEHHGDESASGPGQE